MSQDDFTKLFQYFQRMDAKLDEQTAKMATKDDISQILTRLDSIEKKLESTED